MKDCTCLGSCRGAAGLGEGWRCSLGSDKCEGIPTAPSVAQKLENRALAVTRFEVIDEHGRAFYRRPCEVELSFQDNDRTLKVFTKGGKPDADSPTAKELHLFDVYHSLGVEWGNDVFAEIERLKASALPRG